MYELSYVYSITALCRYFRVRKHIRRFVRDTLNAVDVNCIPVDIIGGCIWKFVVQHITYRHCVQTPRSGVCSTQHPAFTAFEAGVLVLSLIQRHVAIQGNRLYVTIIQKHTDPIASVIVVVEDNHLFLTGHFRFDIFQKFGRFVTWSHPYKFLRHENVMQFIRSHVCQGLHLQTDKEITYDPILMLSNSENILTLSYIYNIF